MTHCSPAAKQEVRLQRPKNCKRGGGVHPLEDGIVLRAVSHSRIYATLTEMRGRHRAFAVLLPAKRRLVPTG